MSHYKIESASDCRYLHDVLCKMLRAPIYYDSSTLSDLRTLFTEGVHQSDCIVLVATRGVLTRPWCLLELLEATRKKIPILPIGLTGLTLNVTETRSYIHDIENDLAKNNPPALELIREHMGESLVELQEAIFAVLDNFEALIAQERAIEWNPHIGDSAMVAKLKDLVEEMARVTGRGEVGWIANAPQEDWTSTAIGAISHIGGSGSESRTPSVFLSFVPGECMSDARVLQSGEASPGRSRPRPADSASRCTHVTFDPLAELANAEHRPVARIDVASSKDFDRCPAYVLLLSKDVLYKASTLFMTFQALRQSKLLITVHLAQGGYDYAVALERLHNLEENMSREAPEELAKLRVLLRGPSAHRSSWFSALRSADLASSAAEDLAREAEKGALRSVEAAIHGAENLAREAEEGLEHAAERAEAKAEAAHGAERLMLEAEAGFEQAAAMVAHETEFELGKMDLEVVNVGQRREDYHRAREDDHQATSTAKTVAEPVLKPLPCLWKVSEMSEGASETSDHVD